LGSDEEPLVSLRGVVKSFPDVLACDHVDFTLRRGEVHALLGENGAGKTTLMNILFGLQKPDAGEIWVRGRRVNILSPRDAMKLGIGMVHQHFRLIPTHTVAENVVVGSGGFFINSRKVSQELSSIISFYGWRISPQDRVWQLSAGERQQVELLKILYRKASILILDEPTSVLTPLETRVLFSTLRMMAGKGLGVIFITHKLDEVFAVSDRITVMRKGKVVGTVQTGQTNNDQLANLMFGRPVAVIPKQRALKVGGVALSLDNLWVQDDKGLMAVAGVTLEVRAGEIVGVAGVAGNGQQELLESVVGLRKVRSGTITIDGVDVTNRDVSSRARLGVAYIPSENSRSIAYGMSVAENLVLKSVHSRPLSRLLFLNWKAVREHSEKLIREFDIVTPSAETKARNLSGGNLQRLTLARELSGLPSREPPRLIIAGYPTRGLDAAAADFVRRLLLEFRSQGSAVLFVSEDLEEVMMLSDRVAVMFKGKIAGLLKQEECNVGLLAQLMTGATRSEYAA